MEKKSRRRINFLLPKVTAVPIVLVVVLVLVIEIKNPRTRTNQSPFHLAFGHFPIRLSPRSWS